MLTNTEIFYKALRSFQDKRHELTQSHDEQIKQLEPLKNSKAYADRLKAINTAYSDELKAIQKTCRVSVNLALSEMVKCIDRQTTPPPTTEQIATLTVLNMRQDITQDELDRIANTMRDNPLAMGMLDEIAKKKGILKPYRADTTTIEQAKRLVKSLSQWASDFIKHDTRYGHSPENGEPPKRKAFTSPDEMYSQSIGTEYGAILENMGNEQGAKHETTYCDL